MTTILADPLKAVIAQRALLTQETRPGLCGKNGNLQDWRFELRYAILDPDVCEMIAQRFLKHYGKGPYQLVSLEMASVPLCAYIAAISGANHLIVRKEAKPYGTFALVEGSPKKMRTIFVDDLVNSGRHLIHAEAALAPIGIEMREIFTVIRVPNRNWDERVERLDYAHHYFYDATEFDVVVKQLPRVQWKNFKSLWYNRPTYTTERGSFPQSSPVVDGGLIFHGGRDCHFRCLDAETGKTVWERPFAFHPKSSLSTPAVRDGRVYFAAYDGSARCFGRDGTEIWRTAAAEWIGSSPCLGRDRLFIGLEHARTGMAGGIAALSLETGAGIWEQGVPNWVHASPAYDAAPDMVYCGSNDRAVFCLKGETGEVVWLVKVGGDVKNKPVVAGDVFVGTMAGTVECLRAGIHAWVTPLPDGIVANMLLHEGKLWVPCLDRHLYALDPASGAVLHKTFANARLMSAPSVIAGNIFVGTNYGRALEIDPEDGVIVGKHYLHDRIATSIAHHEGIFIAAVHDGTVVGFRRE